MAFSGRGSIKTYCHMTWLLFVEQINQGIGKTKLGIGVFPFAGDTGAPDQCIIGAENECEGIQ